MSKNYFKNVLYYVINKRLLCDKGRKVFVQFYFILFERQFDSFSILYKYENIFMYYRIFDIYII